VAHICHSKKCEITIYQQWFAKKLEKVTHRPVPAYILHLLFHLIKPQNYKNKKWFLFVVKATALTQQISKFYPQILSKKLQ